MDDLIERLAREAGLPQAQHFPGMPSRPSMASLWDTELRRFAALVAAECEKVCIAAHAAYSDTSHIPYSSAVQRDEIDRIRRAAADGAKYCARQIRAKFKEPCRG